MSRLTKKYEDNSGYAPVVNHPVRKEITLFDFEEQDYDCCVEKLGKLEDIMEHFKINSIDQLINILEAWEVVKNKSVDIHDVIHCSSLDVFNCGLYEKYQLTEEEYNKVKKALEVEDNVD